MSGRIFVPLATEPFRRFESGTKGVEVRAMGSPVAQAVLSRDMGVPVLLRRGYSTPDELHGRLGLWVIAESLAALPVEFRIAADLPKEATNRDYYDADKPVLAFQVLDVPHWGEA